MLQLLSKMTQRHRPLLIMINNYRSLCFRYDILFYLFDETKYLIF